MPDNRRLCILLTTAYCSVPVLMAVHASEMLPKES